MRYEVPAFVKVVYDDAHEDDTVEKVIVVDEREDIHLAEDRRGHHEVYDAEFQKTTDLADKVVAIAGREQWPEGEILVHGEQWESGPDPRREPVWYDDGDPYEDDGQEAEPSTAM